MNVLDFNIRWKIIDGVDYLVVGTIILGGVFPNKDMWYWMIGDPSLGGVDGSATTLVQAKYNCYQNATIWLKGLIK